MIFRWILTVLIVMELGGYILEVGKPQEPHTNLEAYWCLVYNAVIIFGIIR